MTRVLECQRKLRNGSIIYGQKYAVESTYPNAHNRPLREQKTNNRLAQQVPAMPIFSTPLLRYAARGKEHTGLAQPFGPECATETSVSQAEGSHLSGRKQETDRRKWDRLPLAIPIFVRSKDGNDKELLEFATALNVSAGGALVAVRRALPLSSQVLLEIPSAPLVSGSNLPKASRNLQARIVWAKHAEGYQLAGVKFSHALLSAASGLPVKRRKAVSPV